jgi:hypothetical protein
MRSPKLAFPFWNKGEDNDLKKKNITFWYPNSNHNLLVFLNYFNVLILKIIF